MLEVETDDMVTDLAVNDSLFSSLTTTASNASTEITHELMLSIAKWINGLIIILGLITNTLILIILVRRKIGSQTTRIILLFLAATDLSIMIIELFLHYIPIHWRWIPIFHTDLSCGFAFWIQASVTTASAWYLMLMTMERFTVVYFPIKAKIICTQGKILGACILIPIASLICYCYLIVDIEVVPSTEYNYNECKPKEQDKDEFKSKIVSWIVLYFFIPAFTIVMLNTAIVVRLAQAHKLQREMTKNGGSSSKTRQRGSSIKAKLSRTMSRSASSKSSGSQSIRKATSLVVAASITFVVLMIPRGVSTTLSLDIEWDYESTQMFLLDHVAYLLQYLNHAINFFLYVLANNNFRKEMQKIFHCNRAKPRQSAMRLHSEAETDMTQTTCKHRKRSLQRDSKDVNIALLKSWLCTSPTAEFINRKTPPI